MANPNNRIVTPAKKSAGMTKIAIKILAPVFDSEVETIWVILDSRFELTGCNDLNTEEGA